MRRTRWLFLAAILGIVAWVSATYLKTKAFSDRNAPVAPKPLEAGIDARSQKWTYTKSNGTLGFFHHRRGNEREQRRILYRIERR